MIFTDPEEASNFIQTHINFNENAPKAGPSSENNVIWTTKRPTALDHEATEYFLKLREFYNSKFEDKKTVKKNIWTLIVQKMNEAGYNVGQGKEAGEKCRMKFANMQKQYLLYIKHIKTTGVEHRDPPLYFEEMHKILGGQDKVYPKNLQDSLVEPGNSENCLQPSPNSSFNDNGSCSQPDQSTLNENSSQSSENSLTKEEIKNRFSTMKSLKPKTTSEKLITIMTDQHVERQNNFVMLEKLIETQNNQRETLLKHIEALIKLERKRKRRESDSDTD